MSFKYHVSSLKYNFVLYTGKMCQQSLFKDKDINKSSELDQPLADVGNPVSQRCILKSIGNALIGILNLIVFAFLDLLDFILCLVYRLVDYLVEKERTPCYCYNGNKSKEGLSETLYSRKNFARDLVVVVVCFMKKHGKTGVDSVPEKSNCKFKHLGGRWSDCACHRCLSPDTEKLYVAVGGQDIRRKASTDQGGAARQRRRRAYLNCSSHSGSHSCASGMDVIFIHGFLSSSSFWTQTVYPRFSEAVKSNYRLFSVDLLGFGKSPKPINCLYTVEEHIDMIERSVFHPYGVKSFHLVAHSMGCIIALALASKYPNALKSITLLSPPCYPAPPGEQPSHFVLKRIAPKTIWPLLAFGSSIMSWIVDYRIEDTTRHTHFSAWHNFHSVICGTAQEMDKYLEVVGQTDCEVMILHGKEDKVVSVDCSLAIKSRISKTKLKVLDNADHVAVIMGRERILAKELEDLWASCE
ncbi:probable lysophospholipase BODYGUARD 1 isoform X2 [Cryptomeria japonica]|uniref:probable lysophospholipase BODYGUARD 1 isoform X2 n=1 Tax=Cryptomeria japonica TaxID=3369 RepID=UPI0027DA1088|nr:probable lysophospholipase BODYGUARD 1 isoform X2 [Cryptomeria japonica]